MFIETLEFTIPVDLCDLFSTMKRGPHSNLEFPASVNSYGTTQDASVQVVLRSNKLTFKVDGVSSDASMISKSECKTLKLSIFDVDRSLMPQEQFYAEEVSLSDSPVPLSNPAKRLHNSSTIKTPPHKSRKTDSRRSPTIHQNNSHNSEHLQSRNSSDSRVNVKQEPEDPDLIEIEPDPEPEPDDVVPKEEKDSSYMQIDYSSNIPHTQTSQAALDRLSFNQQSSHSQSPASSTSSFHQNVPHVPDYSEAGPSQRSRHSDQSADDYLVFQDENDDYDNDAEIDNDGYSGFIQARSSQSQTRIDSTTTSSTQSVPLPMKGGFSPVSQYQTTRATSLNPFKCPQCQEMFIKSGELNAHIKRIHEYVELVCECGKRYKYQTPLINHQKKCVSHLTAVGLPTDKYLT